MAAASARSTYPSCATGGTSDDEFRKVVALAPLGLSEVSGYGSDALTAWQRGVVAIAARLNSRSKIIGSGFIVDKEQMLVATCAHVVNKAGGGEVMIGFGSPADLSLLVRAEVVEGCLGSSGGPSDYAVLRIKSDTVETVEAWTQARALPVGDSAEVKVGSDVVLLGYGRSMLEKKSKDQTSTKGTIIRGQHGNGGFLTTDALMLAGHSGGPALNNRGEVVGWSIASVNDEVQEGVKYASGINKLGPINEMLSALAKAMGRSETDVRAAQTGTVPAGQYMLRKDSTRTRQEQTEIIGRALLSHSAALREDESVGRSTRASKGAAQLI